jgi:hypothetical protein
MARESRFSGCVVFTCVTPTRSGRFASSIRCCPPNISSVTIDHDELCDLPGGRRVACSVSGSAVVPTDDGARATLGDPVVPAKVAKSKENGFRATLRAARHLADRASVCRVRPLESSPDDLPDSRFPVLPSGSQPFHRSGRFAAYSYRTGKLRTKLSHTFGFVPESLVHNFSRRGV